MDRIKTVLHLLNGVEVHGIENVKRLALAMQHLEGIAETLAASEEINGKEE